MVPPKSDNKESKQKMVAVLPTSPRWPLGSKTESNAGWAGGVVGGVGEPEAEAGDEMSKKNVKVAEVMIVAQPEAQVTAQETPVVETATVSIPSLANRTKCKVVTAAAYLTAKHGAEAVAKQTPEVMAEYSDMWAAWQADNKVWEAFVKTGEGAAALGTWNAMMAVRNFKRPVAAVATTPAA